MNVTTEFPVTTSPSGDGLDAGNIIAIVTVLLGAISAIITIIMAYVCCCQVPNNLEVTHHDSKSANLTWDPPVRHCTCVHRNYRVEVVKLSWDNNPPQPEQTYTNTTHTSIRNLEPDTVYVFKVSAKTGCCVGLPASRQSTTPEGAPTAPPDNLKVTHNDSRSAYLTWNPPPPKHHNGVLTGYLVEVVSVSNPQLVQHEETDAYTTEISISSLKPWTAYVFKVGAKTAGGVGLQASEQSTTPEGVPSAAPRNLKVEQTFEDSVHLSWISPRSDYHNGVLTGYDVLVNGSKHLTTDADSTSLDIHKLKTSTSYTFEVYAVTKAGRGSQAAMKQLTLEVNYCRILAETYEILAKQGADHWTHVGHVDFVELKLVSQTHLDYNRDYRTPRVDIDEVFGKKDNIDCQKVFGQLRNGLRLLFEGRPGTGKTTLLEKLACDLSNEHEKKSYSDANRKFVILVKLRELEMKKNPEEHDLLCTAGCRLNNEDTQTLWSKFARDSGENIIFLFDGLDEYDPVQKGDNFFRQIIDGHVFPKSIVISSSRPTATIKIRQNKGMQVIEVVGFNKQKVFQYIDAAYERDKKKDDRDKLKTHLTNNPKVMNMCYIPLYCAVLVQLYKDDPDESQLPQTEGEFYKCFTLSTLDRYVFKHERINHVQQPPVDELDKLKVHEFDDLKKEDRFKRICKFAYDATEKSEQVFTISDSNIADLDMLVRKSIFVSSRERMKYSFVHLTFQEYLSAIYIAWYCSESEQTGIVRKHHSDEAFRVVWQFFFGILKPFSDDLFRIIQYATPDDHLFHIQCAYESQQPTASTTVLGFHHNSLQFSRIRPSDLPCLAYVLENAKNDPATEYRLNFSDCDFSNDNAKALLEAVGDRQFSLTILQGDAVQSMLDALRDVSVPGLKGLRLIGEATARGSIYENCSGLKSLFLSGNTFGDGGLEALAEGIKNCKELKELYLQGCGIVVKRAEMLGKVLKYVSKLHTISLSGNWFGDCGLEALAEGIKNCKELKELYLHRCGIGVKGVEMLGKVLKYVSKLHTIHLSGNWFSDRGLEALAEGIKNCKELKELYLQYCDLTDDWRTVTFLTELIIHTRKLEVLGLEDNKFTEDGKEKLRQAERERSSEGGMTELRLCV